MRGYSLGRSSWWHLLVVVLTCTVCVWRRSPVPALPAVVVAALLHQWRLTMVALLLGGVVGWRSNVEWAGAHIRQGSVCEGWAQVVEPADAVGRVVVQLGSDRLSTIARGPGARLRDVQVGQRAMVYGRCATTTQRRWLVRHVVGRLRLQAVGAIVDGARSDTLLADVHRAIQRAADATMPAAQAGLFRGLVIGDDSAEPAWLVDAFRRSGLAHLQAVSGENVAFLLAVCGPLTRRLGALPRAMTTLALLGAFAVLTGAQPSVLRAVVMAAGVSVAGLAGERVDPVANLCWCVVALEAIDPFLVWSVGFWLSVGATGGIAACAAPLARRLPLPRWLAQPVAVTISAQLGTLVPSLVVFGRVPLLGLFANLLAVPVAGLVMLVGLPVSVLAGWVPSVASSAFSTVLMWPSATATRWVLDVARITARIEPTGAPAAVGWCTLAGILGGLLWAGRRRVPF